MAFRKRKPTAPVDVPSVFHPVGSEPESTPPPPQPRPGKRSKGVVAEKDVEPLVDKAVRIPSERIREYVAKLRAKHPKASPAQIIHMLERRYLVAVAGGGGAVGAVAAVPAVGTGTAVVLTAGQIGSFLTASTLLSLAVAEVHGIEVDDLQRRRTLLLVSLLGEKGPEMIEGQLGLSAVTWGRTLLTKMPVATVKSVNVALRRRIIATTTAKFGSVALGRLLPFGVGAVIGLVGGRAMGNEMIEGVRAAFGPPPAQFPIRMESTFQDRVPADTAR